jgi:hypothetical protein
MVIVQPLKRVFSLVIEVFPKIRGLGPVSAEVWFYLLVTFGLIAPKTLVVLESVKVYHGIFPRFVYELKDRFENLFGLRSEILAFDKTKPFPRPFVVGRAACEYAKPSPVYYHKSL